MTSLTPLDDDEMSPDEEDEYEIRSNRAIKSLESAAEDLIAIRTKKLYRKEFKTWELFCLGKLGVTGRWALKIENSTVVVKDLTQQIGTTVQKKLISQKTAHETLEAAQGLSVSAGAELHKVPSEKRLEVLQAASVDGEPPTAAAIKEAAKPKPADPAEPEVVYDGTGYPIPEKRLALWNRRGEFEKLFEPIGVVSSFMRRLMEAGSTGNGDILFRDLNAAAKWAELKLIYYSIKTAAPYAVCVDCQGQRSDTCMSCKGSGFVSKHTWDSVVNSDAKRLREMTVKSFTEKAT